jgi:hypothetical protein
MARLNQIIAVVNGKKAQAKKVEETVYHNAQKAAMFEGIARTYSPLDDDGETFPKEVKYVQYRANDALSAVRASVSELLDATATQDWSNCKAVADIVVNGKVVLEKVPVTHLLFLEKQVMNLHTIVSKLPTLDPAEKWTFDKDLNCSVTESHETNKTKKVMRNHVKAEATDKHPAQVETYTEDVKVGEWSTVKYSGAMPASEKNALLARITGLQEALKISREEANQLEITPVKVGDRLFSHIFGG